MLYKYNKLYGKVNGLRTILAPDLARRDQYRRACAQYGCGLISCKNRRTRERAADEQRQFRREFARPLGLKAQRDVVQAAP